MLTGSVCRAARPGTGHNLVGNSRSSHFPCCQICPPGIVPHTSDLQSDIDLEHTYITSIHIHPSLHAFHPSYFSLSCTCCTFDTCVALSLHSPQAGFAWRVTGLTFPIIWKIRAVITSKNCITELSLVKKKYELNKDHLSVLFEHFYDVYVSLHT